MLGRGGATHEIISARQPARALSQRAEPQQARGRTVVFLSMSAPVTDVKARIFERLAETSPYQIAVGLDWLRISASVQQLQSLVRTRGQRPLFVPMSGEALRTRHGESIDNFADDRGQTSGAELAALDWFAGSRFAWMWHLQDDTWSADFGSAASRYANSTADLIIHSEQWLPVWAKAGGWKVGSNAHMRPCGPGLLCFASLAAYRASQPFARALLDEIHRGVASSTDTSHHGLYVPFVISQHPELTWQPLRPPHIVRSDVVVGSISGRTRQLERLPSLCALQDAELFHPVLSVCGSVQGYTLTNERCKGCPHVTRDVHTQEACRALCHTHKSCVAWVYNSRFECFLKGGSRLHWQRERSSLRIWSAPRSTLNSTSLVRLSEKRLAARSSKLRESARAPMSTRQCMARCMAICKVRCKTRCKARCRAKTRSSSSLEHRSHERAPSEAPLWCLLLSATTNVQVDLRNFSFGRLQQRNTSERQHMYAQVLGHWVGAYPEVPIVLAENSNDSLAWSWTDATKGARLERLRIGRAPNCTGEEIGCHEADAILRAVRTSRFFRTWHLRGHEQRLCTHALKVTGRYAVTSDIDAALRSCPLDWDLALQNKNWGGGAGTQVLGFRVALANYLFGWSQLGDMCQECHIQAWLRDHPDTRVCYLPPLNVKPVREGSTGKLVSSI